MCDICRLENEWGVEKCLFCRTNTHDDDTPMQHTPDDSAPTFYRITQLRVPAQTQRRMRGAANMRYPICTPFHESTPLLRETRAFRIDEEIILVCTKWASHDGFRQAKDVIRACFESVSEFMLAPPKLLASGHDCFALGDEPLRASAHLVVDVYYGGRELSAEACKEACFTLDAARIVALEGFVGLRALHAGSSIVIITGWSHRVNAEASHDEYSRACAPLTRLFSVPKEYVPRDDNFFLKWSVMPEEAVAETRSSNEASPRPLLQPARRAGPGGYDTVDTPSWPPQLLARDYVALAATPFAIAAAAYALTRAH